MSPDTPELNALIHAVGTRWLSGGRCDNFPIGHARKDPKPGAMSIDTEQGSDGDIPRVTCLARATPSQSLPDGSTPPEPLSASLRPPSCRVRTRVDPARWQLQPPSLPLPSPQTSRPNTPDVNVAANVHPVPQAPRSEGALTPPPSLLGSTQARHRALAPAPAPTARKLSAADERGRSVPSGQDQELAQRQSAAAGRLISGRRQDIGRSGLSGLQQLLLFLLVLFGGFLAGEGRAAAAAAIPAR
ncbi:hypothetical protein C8Q79DRAFT_1015004 [Trametes meyenii]|nr:hypothetical protein C8Q79DRAFT_1015004 [Trametes meyenii]